MSLQNFTSIFEIVFAYNLAIAFSEKFRNFLGINENVSKLINQHREFQSLHRFIKNREEYGIAFEDRDVQKLNDRFCSIKKKTTLFFLDGKLEKFLQPFYIYFGIVSLFYLFLAGTLDSMVDYIHLMLLNFISFLFFICCFWNSFRISNVKWKSGGIRLFFGSVLIISFTLIIPKEAIATLCFTLDKIDIPYLIQIDGYRNIHVLGSVLLVFTPIVVELMQILICIYQLRKIKRRYDKFVMLIMPIVITGISTDIGYLETDGLELIEVNQA